MDEGSYWKGYDTIWRRYVNTTRSLGGFDENGNIGPLDDPFDRVIFAAVECIVGANERETNESRKARTVLDETIVDPGVCLYSL